MRSGNVLAPSPWAMALKACTPRHPWAFIIRLVEWSSANSGPSPPISPSALVPPAFLRAAAEGSPAVAVGSLQQAVDRGLAVEPAPGRPAVRGVVVADAGR